MTNFVSTLSMTNNSMTLSFLSKLMVITGLEKLNKSEKNGFYPSMNILYKQKVLHYDYSFKVLKLYARTYQHMIKNIHTHMCTLDACS